MNANEYQRLVKRTECHQREAFKRVEDTDDLMGIRLVHSIIGLSGEVGELASAIERVFWYGQKIDRDNIREEIGDCLWYIAEACNSLGFHMAEVMDSNIRKLRQRYPQKFSCDDAKEENRNRQTEADVVKEPYRDVRKDSGTVVAPKGHGSIMEDTANEELNVCGPSGCGYELSRTEMDAVLEEEQLAIVKNLRKEESAKSSGAYPKRLGNKYDRYCLICNIAPVHNLNKSGICSDCAADKRMRNSVGEYERTVQREQTGQGWAEEKEVKEE